MGRSLLFRNQRKSETNKETNKETNNESETNKETKKETNNESETENENETLNEIDNEKSDNQSEATVEDNTQHQSEEILSTREYHFDHFFDEFKSKTYKKRTDYITNFLPKYNQVFFHFTDHNEIVYKSRDGYVVGKPNTNVIRHVVKGKVVKFDDIASGYTSHIHFHHDFGFYPDHKDSHGHNC